MINNTQSCESDFMTWLSNKVSPAQLSELYWCYTEIEASCFDVKILKKPLFETTDYEIVHAVQKYIEQNKYFHAMHRRQFSKLITAGRHYLEYTKEMSMKQSVSEKNISEKKAEAIIHEDETQEENKDSAEETTEQNEWTIDFNSLGSFAYTKPSSFTYFEEKKGSYSSWTELYVSFFAVLYEDYPHLFKPGMSFSVNRGRVELAVRDEAGFMVEPKDVQGTNYAIETNISATNIIRKMKYLLDFCSVDYENVVIKYHRKAPVNEATEDVIVQPIRSSQKTAMIDQISFYRYLIKTQNLSEATSRSYSSAIAN